MTRDKTTQETGFNEHAGTFTVPNQSLDAGHRDRLRKRFAAAPDLIPDYELLELLLFRAIPRADTKPLAKRLLRRFGTISEVFGAPPHLIREIEGAGPAVAHDLKLVVEVAKRIARNEFRELEAMDAMSKVINYCTTAMAADTSEQFRILFLNKKNQLIKDEVQQRGTVDHTPAYPREVVRRALELSATAIILAHNHPSGDSTPSRADIEMTARIVEAARPVNISVHDHIIIGKNGATSLRDLDLM